MFGAAFVGQDAVEHVAVLPSGERVVIAPPASTAEAPVAGSGDGRRTDHSGPTRRAALGTVLGARSGDKGGDANLGLWARTGASWPWLRDTLDVAELKRLLPECAPLAVDRYELPNLRAVNFVIHGLLGEGVAASTRFDPQAKALGEWLRSRYADIPVELL